MKKIIALTSSIIVLSSSLALANPTGLNVDIRCPNSNNPINMLSNNGDYIAGYGVEILQGQSETSIYFKSNSSIKGVSADLENYYNAGVKYTSTTGTVTCAYTSSLSEPSFEVSYTLTNGKGGKATAQGSDSINIILPVGRKA